MPRAPKVPKEPRVPSWSVWRHKTEDWVTTDLAGTLRPYYDYTLKQNVLSPYKAEDFEQNNPLLFEHKAVLLFKRISSGRSKLNFIFEDLERPKGTHIILPDEFARLMTTTTFHQGAIKGVWKFAKKGSTTAIYLVRELFDEDEE